MSLFDFFKRKENISRAWSVAPGLVLTFDFDRHALCGVEIGRPLADLAFLGPVEDMSKARQGKYCYYSRGLEVGVCDGRIDSYSLFWRDYLNEGYQPYVGACIFLRQQIVLHDACTEQQVLQCFGPPYWRDEEDREIILFYEWKEIEWQVELDVDLGLKAVLAVTPPLLADETQRIAYDVNRPWPP